MSRKYLPIELLNPENVCCVSYPISEEKINKIIEMNNIKKCETDKNINNDEMDTNEECDSNKKNVDQVQKNTSNNEINTIEECESDQDISDIKSRVNIIGIFVDDKFHKYDKPNCFFSEPMDLPIDHKIKTSSSHVIKRVIGEVHAPEKCECNRENPKTYLTVI